MEVFVNPAVGSGKQPPRSTAATEPTQRRSNPKLVKLSFFSLENFNFYSLFQKYESWEPVLPHQNQAPIKIKQL